MSIKKIKHFAFDYNRKLGEGSTGTVYLGTDLRSNTPIAVKAIELKNIDNEVTQYLLKNEINALKTTNHPNVLRAIDVVQEPDFVYIVTDYLPNGTLAEYIEKRGSIAETEALEIFKQIVDGYDHIFDLRIYHRDLKPHNILFDVNWKPVLSDFGYCEMTGFLPKPSLQYNVGSPGFMAPESIVGNMYSENSEVWSLATILYEMMTGRNYTNGKPVMEAVMLIKKQGPYYPENSSQFTKKLLKDCMMLKPEERMKVKALKKILHDYVKPKAKPSLPQHQNLSQPILTQQQYHHHQNQQQQPQHQNNLVALNAPPQMAHKNQQEIKPPALPNQNASVNVNSNGLVKSNNEIPIAPGAPILLQQFNMMKNNIPAPNGSPMNVPVAPFPPPLINSIPANIPVTAPANNTTVLPIEHKLSSQNTNPESFPALKNPPILTGDNQNAHLLKNSIGFNQLLSSVNQQTNSMMSPEPNKPIVQPTNNDPAILNNPFNNSNPNYNSTNVIRNLSPRKRGRESLHENYKHNQTLKTQPQQSASQNLSPLQSLPSKQQIPVPTKALNQKSVENLDVVSPQYKTNQNALGFSHQEIKQPLKAIQHTTPQQGLQPNQAPIKSMAVVGKSLEAPEPASGKVSIQNPFTNRNTLPVAQSLQLQPKVPQQIIPPQIPQQLPQQTHLQPPFQQPSQQIPLVPFVPLVPQILKDSPVQTTINNSKRMQRSSKKNLNESGYQSEPDTAPFYMPNLQDEEFDYGFIISNGISNNLLGRDALFKNSPTKPNTEQSIRSRNSTEKQFFSPIDYTQMKPAPTNSFKNQNQVRTVNHQQPHPHSQPHFQHQHLLAEQRTLQKQLEEQLQQQQKLIQQQSKNHSQTLIELEKAQLIQPIVNQPNPNMSLNPLGQAQSIQIPQMNYPGNPIQQQLRNSQQLPNDFKARNSLVHSSKHHPVPMFNSGYNNVIVPNYFGYATGS